MTDDLRHRIALAIWDGMVSDEPPADDETLWREGFFDAADAVLRLLAAESRTTERIDP